MENGNQEPLLKLEDWVIKMIEEKKTDSEEFQAALKLFGRPKLEAIWKKYRERKKSEVTS